MRWMVKILVVGFAVALLALPALAEDEDGPDYARTGLYFGVSLAASSYLDLDDDFEKTVGPGHDLDTSLGFDVLIGYRAVPNAAFEAKFTMLPGADFTDKGTGSKVAEVQTWTASYNAKFFLMTGKFQPFGAMGFGYMKSTVDDFQGGTSGLAGTRTDFAGTIGLGADMYVTENVALTGEFRYQYTTGKLDAYDALNFGAGLIYRF